MKQLKEKSEAQKVIERLKDKPMPEGAKEAVRKKQAYVNREINK